MFLIPVYSCYMICLTRCNMVGTRYAREVAYWGCGMLGMWDVGDMFGKWDVPDVGCSGCGMFGMWDVRHVGCSACGMFGMWDVRHVGCSRCGMWDVGCLPGCGMLIYKMPNQSMQNAANEFRFKEQDNRNAEMIDNNFENVIADITVSGDGSCRKRGFSCLNGLFTLIASDSRRCVDYRVLTKSCSSWSSWELRKGTEP